LFNEFKIIWI